MSSVKQGTDWSYNDSESLFSPAPQEPVFLEDGDRTSRSQSLRIAVAVVLLVCVVLVLIDSFTSKRIETTVLAFFDWVEANPFLGVLSVILVYILATILFIPGSVLTVGTGFAFGSAFGTFKGVVLASTAVFFGAFLGSVASFLLGRYLFRDWVTRLASSYPIFQAVDRALQENGLQIMILLRLSPLIPFNALDYMSGLTSIPLWMYCVATIAILPGTVMYTFIGATASSILDGTNEAAQNHVVRVVSIVFGITFAVLGVSVASYYSKLELEKILESNQEPTSASPLRGEEATLSEMHRRSGKGFGAAIPPPFSGTLA